MFKDLGLTFPILFLLLLSVTILKSVAPGLFPSYFIFIILSLVLFWFFSQIDFEITALFSTHFYVVAILLLLVNLLIGRITNNTIRWIPIGDLSLQPSEVVRPLLLVFFAKYLTGRKLNSSRFIKSLLLLLIPTFLILIQPSFSVALLTVVAFFGVFISTDFNKKYLLVAIGLGVLLIPLVWQVLQPYQKSRIASFLSPESDPRGAGYNSIQSVVAAGAGKLTGRGLGKGVQTQLSFLPEKQTDFIFAAVSEELGFLGAGLMLTFTFLILFKITHFMENSASPAARAYLSGFFFTYAVQVFIHTGMNIGILPVAGLPFPLVSAGGSSLVSTMIGLGIAVSAYKKS